MILKKVKKMGFSLLVGIADLLVAGLLGNLEAGGRGRTRTLYHNDGGITVHLEMPLSLTQPRGEGRRKLGERM